MSNSTNRNTFQPLLDLSSDLKLPTSSEHGPEQRKLADQRVALFIHEMLSNLYLGS